MQAVTQNRYGTPDVLELTETPLPVPNDEQVLIDVKASSLNMYDWHMLTGTPYMVRAIAGLTKPKREVPGSDVSGVVVAVGKDVTGFSIGDEVFGGVGAGAFAEYAIANPKSLAHKPSNLSFEQAAAVPMAALTALQALSDVGGLESGHRVVVNGASGGVGTYAVQIAKALGAEVTAVCSTTKVDMVRSLGADTVIDYQRDDYVDTERDFDILLDNAGNRPWSDTSKVLADGGINVSISGPKKRWLGPFRALLFRKVLARFGGKRMTWFTASTKRADLETLAEMLESGQIAPVIEKVYSLDEVPEALAYIGEGHARAKLVISIDGS
ncbi:MAG: NAD(P)-dependent alcohol dehydrogenase [Acidimicrobiia bacterium]|nr:NAD(P)-dependent alcohol dehydrogenase [Acidimicrobiia bacterium]